MTDEPNEPIELTYDGPIATLTIRRPKSLNALDRETLEALGQALRDVRARAPRCLIVASAVERAFVAGADIAAMSKMTAAEAHPFAQLGQAVFAALEALLMPVIAAVNGFALGGGCELALACDFIFASE